MTDDMLDALIAEHYAAQEPRTGPPRRRRAPRWLPEALLVAAVLMLVVGGAVWGVVGPRERTLVSEVPPEAPSTPASSSASPPAEDPDPSPSTGPTPLAEVPASSSPDPTVPPPPPAPPAPPAGPPGPEEVQGADATELPAPSEVAPPPVDEGSSVPPRGATDDLRTWTASDHPAGATAQQLAQAAFVRSTGHLDSPPYATPEASVAAWQAACDAGHAPSCDVIAAGGARLGEGVRAIRALAEHRCHPGDPVVCIARNAAERADGRADAKAASLLRTGCSGDDPLACLDLARYSARRAAEGGKRAEAYAKGAEMVFDRLCQGGFAPACEARGGVLPMEIPLMRTADPPR